MIAGYKGKNTWHIVPSRWLSTSTIPYSTGKSLEVYRQKTPGRDKVEEIQYQNGVWGKQNPLISFLSLRLHRSLAPIFQIWSLLKRKLINRICKLKSSYNTNWHFSYQQLVQSHTSVNQYLSASAAVEPLTGNLQLFCYLNGTETLRNDGFWKPLYLTQWVSSKFYTILSNRRMMNVSSTASFGWQVLGRVVTQ